MNAITSYGQESQIKQRLMLGYGIPNYPKMILSNVESSFGPFELSYKTFLTDKLSIGLIYNMNGINTKDVHIVKYVIVDTYIANLIDYTYHYSIKFNTFLAKVDYSWLNKDMLNFYSGVCIGWVFVNASTKLTVKSGDSDVPKFNGTSSGLAYQVTLIGCHFIIVKHFGCYAELGYGYNSILNAGLSWTFDGNKND